MRVWESVVWSAGMDGWLAAYLREHGVFRRGCNVRVRDMGEMGQLGRTDIRSMALSRGLGMAWVCGWVGSVIDVLPGRLVMMDGMGSCNLISNDGACVRLHVCACVCVYRSM